MRDSQSSGCTLTARRTDRQTSIILPNRTPKPAPAEKYLVYSMTLFELLEILFLYKSELSTDKHLEEKNYIFFKTLYKVQFKHTLMQVVYVHPSVPLILLPPTLTVERHKLSNTIWHNMLLA